MTSGVYMILNRITGKPYIGASRNIEARWRIHRSQLADNKHVNVDLCRDWQTYGASAFEFSVIEEISDLAKIAECENQYIEALREDLREVGIYNKDGKGGFMVHTRPSSIAILGSEHVKMKITGVERAMLEELMARWHPTDGRVISMTIRECIRESHEREFGKPKKSEKSEKSEK